MLTPEQRAMGIGHCTCHNASDSLVGKHDQYCIFTRIAVAIHAAERAAYEQAAQVMDEYARLTRASGADYRAETFEMAARAIRALAEPPPD